MRCRLVVAIAVLASFVVGVSGLASAESVPDARGIAVLDADTGDVRWTRAAPNGLTFQGGRVGNGVVIATERTCKEYEEPGDPDPVLRAFESERASVRWSTPGYGVATRSMIGGPVPPVDVGADGVVVVGGGRYGADVRGVGLRNGKQVWAADAESHELGVSSTLVFTAAGERSSSVLRASSRRTGKEMFTFPTTADAAWTETFDVVAADAETIVVANGGYTGRRGSDPLGPTTFFVLDATTGKERSRFESADPRLLFSGLALGHGLLVYSERGSIVARGLNDGSVVWRKSFHDQQPRLSASTSDVVVVATDGGAVRALDLRTGARRWAIVDALVRAYDQRTIVLIRTNGRDRGVRAVAMDSGDVRWSRQLPSSMPGSVSQVAFAVDGDTVVLTDACDLG